MHSVNGSIKLAAESVGKDKRESHKAKWKAPGVNVLPLFTYF